MTSDIEICNQALAFIGARNTIANFDEDSLEAITCQQFYDVARKDCLQEFWWGFAKAQAQLTLLDSLPSTNVVAPQTPLTPSQISMLPWLYKYAYPADCIQARFLIPFCSTTFLPNWQYTYDAETAIRYVVGSDVDAAGNETKVLYCNEPQAILCYTRDVTNTAMFDSQFGVSLAHLLGGYVTMAINGNVAIRDSQFKMAQINTENAEESSANEGLTFQNHVPDWISARGYSARMPGIGIGFGFNDPGYGGGY